MQGITGCMPTPAPKPRCPQARTWNHIRVRQAALRHHTTPQGEWHRHPSRRHHHLYLTGGDSRPNPWTLRCQQQTSLTSGALTPDGEACEAAIRMVRELTQEAEIGKLYLGIVNEKHKVQMGKEPKYERWRDEAYVQLFNRTVHKIMGLHLRTHTHGTPPSDPAL